MKVVTEKRRRSMMTQGVRDLLAAGWLGEQTFAHLGLHRAVGVVSEPEERTKVISAAWRAERPVGALITGGLAAVAVGALVRDIEESSWLDTAASGCALGAAGASVACALLGRAISHADELRLTPIRTGFRPDEETPPRARAAQRALSIVAPIGMLLGATSIGLSIASRRYD